MTESLDKRALLERAFRFDAHDLAANQAGRLGQTQCAYLEQSRLTLKRGHQLGSNMLTALGLVGLVVAVVFLIEVLTKSEHVLFAIAGFAVFVLTSAGLILWSTTAKAMSPPVFPDRVESVEGEIFFEKGDDDGWPTMPVFQIDGLKFHVGLDARAALTDGGRYRIYYIQTSVPSVMGVLVSPMILSVEERTSLPRG